jgi:hypothetical protein
MLAGVMQLRDDTLHWEKIAYLRLQGTFGMTTGTKSYKNNGVKQEEFSWPNS